MEGETRETGLKDGYTFKELVKRQKQALERRYPYADKAAVELIAHELVRLRESVKEGSLEKNEYREVGSDLIAAVEYSA